MKILRVIASMNPEHGGPCQGIRNSIPALQLLGVENEVVCFDSPDAGYLGMDGFAIHAIGPAKSPYAYCAALQPWLMENFARFDAVIIHGLWLHNSYGTYKAWKSFKKNNSKFPKLFVMPHGMLDPYFQKAKDRKVKAIRNWLFWKLFENKVVNKSSGVLFTCQEELLLARQPFTPYNPNAELNVGYGIPNPVAFSQQMLTAFYDKCPQVANKPYIVFLSRIHPKKGVDLLINAYNTLYKNNKTIPALVIAGPGLDTDYGKQLKATAGDNIYFPGMLGGSSKWGAFYCSEAFILPSHQENFGIAVVEAMAAGKAVIISDQVNIWREIKDGNGGIIIKDTQEGALSGLEQWVNLTQDQKTAMGVNAQNTYKKFFSIEQAALNLKTIFEQQING